MSKTYDSRQGSSENGQAAESFKSSLIGSDAAEFIMLKFRMLASMPFIYAMFFPLLILHFFLELYHQVSFRLYGIPLVDKNDYFFYDRQLMGRLNWLQKINCVYCSYANNLLHYAVEIAARTERYWCPIKYFRDLKFRHSQYSKFLDENDADHLKEEWEKLKDFSDLERG